MTEEQDTTAKTVQGILHPEIRSGKDSSLIERRNIIASVFIAMLIGIAYSEMFAPVRDSVRSGGITAGTLFLAFTFFFTSMRFFIGNQLHLLSENVVKMRGDMWLYDFLMITFQTLLLCFLGGLSAVPVNRAVSVDFIDLLVALYCVDVAWILSQWFLGVVVRPWKRPFIPWAWAVMNSVLICVILGLPICFTDTFSTWALASLFVANVVAFILDIILIDHYDVI